VPETDLLTFSRGLGAFSLIGLPLAGISTIVLWQVRRRSQLSNLDYSILILIGLLAGPITWDHYTSWSILALMLLVSPDLWRNLTPRLTLSLLCALAVAAALMIVPTFTFSSEDIVSSPWLRLFTGTKTVALLLFCAVTLYMLVRSSRSDPHAAVVLRT
jgi:magnesium-transporting ATPase (P-type)